MTTPAIILVQPQMGENIGAVARAMKNFGLCDLRIVNPRDGWPNEAAVAMAAHGEDIIHAATIYDSTRDAVADLHTIYASTARDRSIRKPQLTPREAAEDGAKRSKDGQKLGILFGPERSGLSNEDIALSDALLTVPTDPACSSLNLGQSAVVIGYEWWIGMLSSMEQETVSGETTSPEPVSCENQEIFAETKTKKGEQKATRKDIDGFFDHLEAALDDSHFFKQDEKKPKMWRNLRATFLRAEFSTQEVQSLRGIISALSRGRR